MLRHKGAEFRLYGGEAVPAPLKGDRLKGRQPEARGFSRVRLHVRKEGLYIGCPAILVYVPKQELCGISDFTWVFTPFMLTEEGAKKHK